ncbi:MAG: hypothetical protein FJ147_13030 [Deltaproteobacteria bacterium]|nr:hypothetical protein [Deltaproteobacteria bacterium]
MSRIPDAELARLKRDLSIEQLALAHGIVLKPSGKNLLGLCPFHDDHEPSLSIEPAQNLWHCFGCQQGGGVIDWVMKAEGVSFRHAVELIRTAVVSPQLSVVSTTPTTQQRIVKHSRTTKLAVPLPGDADAQQWTQVVMDDYHTTLTDRAPEGKAYLANRGLLNNELITTFKLGFANCTLGYRLPRMETTEGAVIRGTLQQLGYLRPSGHEHLRGCLTVPILDADGHVTEMYGRRITHGRTPEQPVHLYLPGPHKGVWNLAAFTNSSELILCEAAFDAMTFWVHGFRHVTFSYGVEGFTADQLTVDGHPRSVHTQHTYLVTLRSFFHWLTKQHCLPSSPASELTLPKLGSTLPVVITSSEAEQILSQMDLTSPLGLRDRAMLETFYSSGIRRAELCGLLVQDVDVSRGTLFIRHGKGNKARMVLIGERAMERGKV